MLLSRRLTAANWGLSLRGGSVVFTGWRSVYQSPTGEHYCADPIGINKDVAQGEIVNILLKIKNSFLPTKQILIGL
ncbi:hypothetical protein ACK3ZG_15000, partial [Aeromonas caviae]